MVLKSYFLRNKGKLSLFRIKQRPQEVPNINFPIGTSARNDRKGVPLIKDYSLLKVLQAVLFSGLRQCDVIYSKKC